MRSMRFYNCMCAICFMATRRFLFLANYRAYASLVMCNDQSLRYGNSTKWQITAALPHHNLADPYAAHRFASLLFLLSFACLLFTWNHLSVFPIHQLDGLCLFLNFISSSCAKQWNTREIASIITAASNNNRSFNKWLLSWSDGLFLGCRKLVCNELITKLWLDFKSTSVREVLILAFRSVFLGRK